MDIRKRLSGLLCKKGGMSGYMTVEASVIVPMVFMCFVIVICYTFYLYNHLVIYQSCFLAALRGSQVKNATAKAVEEYVDKELGKLLDEQVYRYGTGHESHVGAFSIRVFATSDMSMIAEVKRLLSDNRLSAEKELSILRIDPVDYIRNCDRGKGGTQ